MASGTEERLLISVSSAAERLGLARSYVYSALVMTGRLRSLKIGKRRLIPVEELRRWLEQELRETSTDSGRVQLRGEARGDLPIRPTQRTTQYVPLEAVRPAGALLARHAQGHRLSAVAMPRRGPDLPIRTCRST